MNKALEQLRKMSLADLQKKLVEERIRVWELQRDVKTGKAKNVHEAGIARVSVAQVLTVLKEKESTN